MPRRKDNKMENKIYGDIDKVQLFGLMNDGSSTYLKDLPDGQEMEVEKAALIEKEDETTVLFLILRDGTVVSTTSPTAIKTYLAALSFFGTHSLRLCKTSGTGKNGRTYHNLRVTGVLDHE